MLKFNRDRGTLEQDDYIYQLQDSEGPNLYRDIYSYGEVPKIPFNHRLVPMRVPKQNWITDTTFRDGQQALPPFTVKQTVDIYDMLHRLGGPNGIIRQCEFFLYSDKDKETVRRCLEKGYQYPEVTGWIRADKKDFKLVKEMGLKETGILTSASDYHIYLKLKKTRRQAMEGYLDIVRGALEVGVIPRCHLEDVTRADFYGFVVPFAQELMKLSAQAKMPIKIRICDTMGYGVTYPGASLPRSVKGIAYGLCQYAYVPSEWLEWHGHNDFYKALINATTAWLYGCCSANGTLFGIGERTGNPPIEGLVMEYIALKGTTDGMDTAVITELADYFRREVGYEIPRNMPLVGEDFNVTRAGIHADGMMKNEEIYNIFDTQKILNRPPGVAITDKSGLAGITHWINIFLGFEGNAAVDKRHPGVARIAAWIEEEYRKDRTTPISREEMEMLAKQHLPDEFASSKRVKSTPPVASGS